ncbi:hypothetical protein B0H11DRAFT_1899302 [Mycena galericulata]|nr:hypothetical protein B0H11DRAFT_1899302 [Mycena galericulata]
MSSVPLPYRFPAPASTFVSVSLYLSVFSGLVWLRLVKLHISYIFRPFTASPSPLWSSFMTSRSPSPAFDRPRLPKKPVWATESSSLLVPPGWVCWSMQDWICKVQGFPSLDAYYDLVSCVQSRRAAALQARRDARALRSNRRFAAPVESLRRSARNPPLSVDVSLSCPLRTPPLSPLTPVPGSRSPSPLPSRIESSMPSDGMSSSTSDHHSDAFVGLWSAAPHVRIASRTDIPFVHWETVALVQCNIMLSRSAHVQRLLPSCFPLRALHAELLSLHAIILPVYPSLDTAVSIDLISGLIAAPSLIIYQCKLLLRDFPRFSSWVASVPQTCGQCAAVPDLAAKHGGCIILPFTCVCGPCKARKVKCPYQLAYLFEQTKAQYYSSRTDFDLAMQAIKPRRSRPSPHALPMSTAALALPPPPSVELPCSVNNGPLDTGLPVPFEPGVLPSASSSAYGRVPSADASYRVDDDSSDSTLPAPSVSALRELSEGNSVAGSGASSSLFPFNAGVSFPSSSVGPPFLCVSSSFTREILSGLDRDALTDLVLSLTSRLEVVEAGGTRVPASPALSSSLRSEDVLRRCVDLVSAYHYQLLVAAQVARHRLVSPLGPEVDLPNHASLVLDSLLVDIQSTLSRMLATVDECQALFSPSP